MPILTQLDRIVRNDHNSKPLTKGILDDNLLSAFEDLPIGRHIEVTHQIAVGPALKHLPSLRVPW